ncbi:uncharacterized protein LOC143378839 isoform X3 [Andrena cerasifolii]
MKVTKDFSFSAAAEQAPFIGTGFAAITKYVNTVLKVTKFAEILDEMKINLNAEKTDEEKSISHYYVKRAVLYGFLYKLNIYSGCVVFSVLPFVPKLLDLIKPLNESRPHIYIFPGYYFVDNDEYYNYILTFMIWNVYFVAMMFLGCDMIMIYLVQHACGLLAIAGYRFRHATDDVLPSQKGLRSSMHIKYRKLCLSIKSHNRAIEMINEIEKVYAVNLFLQVANATYLFSVTLLLVALRGFTMDTFLLAAYIPIQTIHVLFLTVQGQFVVNTNDYVYDMTYNALWYEEPVKFQAVYVLALRRGLTPPVLTAGGLVPLNLDTFAEIIKASVSYYMFLKSTE